MIVRIAVLCVSFLAIFTQVADAKDTIAALLANPNAYAGKNVILIGKVVFVAEIPGGSPKYPKPPKYNVRFCDGTDCIKAIAADEVTADATALWRVQGTFHPGQAGNPNWVGDARFSSFTPPPDAPSPSPSGT